MQLGKCLGEDRPQYEDLCLTNLKELGAGQDVKDRSFDMGTQVQSSSKVAREGTGGC